VLDRALAGRIKLVGLDVDGVLTDGGIYLGLVANHALEFKRFHVQDGLGVKLLRTVGLPVVLVSGRASEATEVRAKEMEVDELLEVAPADKLPEFVGALERRGSRSPTARTWATTWPTCPCCARWPSRSRWQTPSPK